ncbi:MAG: RNA methyltransferase [Gemmatimonadaceae bacterium]|nr:RNA methyltransferase [Gemmatimonadaceae bacterium]
MKLLTLARDLKRRKARERHALFVAEGVRAVEALLDSGHPVRGALVTTPRAGEEADPTASRRAALLDRLAAAGVPVHEVTDTEFASAADTESPQGVLAIGSIPHWTPEDRPPVTTVLVLDAVQDPGNVGTIVRTAAALGVDVTIALPGTVDVWNAKVVRSAMGALFTHPVMPLSWEDATRWLTDREVALWVADTAGTSLAEAATARPPRLALVVANEGAGVSPHVAAAAHRQVAIPMRAGVESLNVAVATGILLYTLTSRPS